MNETYIDNEQPFKVKGQLNLMTVTQAQLAELLNLSRPRINQLIDEEIVIRDESSKSGAVFLIDSLKNYYLSKKAAADDNGGSVNFWKERALHERAKRELAELKLRERRGELYEAETVERAFVNILTLLRTNLLSLPAKFARQLEGKPHSEIYAILSAEIEYQLTTLSEFNISKLAEEVPADDDEDV